MIIVQQSCYSLLHFPQLLQALHTTQNKTKKAFCEGELREGDLEKQRQEAEEKLAAVEKEREVQLAQGQIAVSNALSEVERLTNMCNDLTIVSSSCSLA